MLTDRSDDYQEKQPNRVTNTFPDIRTCFASNPFIVCCIPISSAMASGYVANLYITFFGEVNQCFCQ